jgi:hypothetical protein
VKTLDSDYGIKIALMNEYKSTLEMKKMYEDLTESFRYIVGDLFDYAEKNKIDLPNRNRIYRIIEKAKQLIEYRMSRTSEKIPSYLPTEFQQRNKTPDDETEPIFIIKIMTKQSQIFFQEDVSLRLHGGYLK